MATEETYHNSPAADSDLAAELREQEFVADPTSPQLILGEPEQGSTTAKVASAGIVQSIGKLVGYASGILTLALTARLLTASDFGAYTTIAVVYLLFVAVIADFGIFTIAVREGSREPERLRDVYHTAFTLKAIAAIVVYAASFILIFFLPYTPEAKVGTIILGVTTMIASIAAGFEIVFQVNLRMAVPSYADIMSKLFVLAGTAALYVANMMYRFDSLTLFYAVIGVVSLSNLIGIAGRWWGANRIMPVRLRLVPGLTRTLLQLAIPMFVVAILSQIHYKADAFILSLIHPPQYSPDVAIYGVAYRMVDFMLLFFVVFIVSVFPVLSAYSQADGEKYRQAARRVLDATFALSVPATVGVILLAPEIVAIVGGDRYPQAALPMQILALAVILTGISQAYNYMIIVQNGQRNLVWITIILVIANVGLNLYFVPIYSYIASAVITVVTTGLGMLLAILVASRHQRVGPSWLNLLKILGAAAAMAIVIEALRFFLFPTISLLGTLVMVAAGAAVYGVILLTIGGVDDGVMLLLRRRLARLTGRAA
jgi:O-antigen/teichoic acid export membrane protein